MQRTCLGPKNAGNFVLGIDHFSFCLSLLVFSFEGYFCWGDMGLLPAVFPPLLASEAMIEPCNKQLPSNSSLSYPDLVPTCFISHVSGKSFSVLNELLLCPGIHYHWRERDFRHDSNREIRHDSNSRRTIQAFS